jgi:hypothetical protein
MKELELVRLYFYFCECYDKELYCYNQRFSRNSSPKNEKLTDIELLTIYFYCRRYENKQSKTDIHDYAIRYMHKWFPNLTTYKNFCVRLNRLSSVMTALVPMLLESCDFSDIDTEKSLVDSFPIILCSGKRAGKVAPELSDKSYCATKDLYYFGVKIHAVASPRQKKLPFPEFLSVTSASENDLTAIRPILPKLVNRSIIADKAYADTELNDELMINQNTYIYTPVKLVKGEIERVRQFKKAADDLFSTAVSRMRQPIESLFNWINEKTNIQSASKVRATSGLLIHIFGAIAAALLFWLF